ncbi:MAG: hypothetical protein JSV76_00840 [Candidatus Bathyarchaeota archaeon]|nr:MAG: hypothetical protein JSV76_00840 [Candidatus Bathyarchaeota archaeon]
MEEKHEKQDLLNRFLEMASKTWNDEELTQIQPTIIRIVEAIRIIDQVQLKPEEEPAVSMTHFHQKNVSSKYGAK